MTYVSIEGGGGGGGGSGREVSHSSEKEESDELAVVDDEFIIMSDSKRVISCIYIVNPLVVSVSCIALHHDHPFVTV